MNPQPHSARMKEIFEKAIEFTATDDRQGYVNETCNGNALLLARVQTLLRAHFENGESFLPQLAEFYEGKGRPAEAAVYKRKIVEFEKSEGRALEMEDARLRQILSPPF